MPSPIQDNLQKEPNYFERNCRLVQLGVVEDNVLLERCHPQRMVGLAQTVIRHLPTSS